MPATTLAIPAADGFPLGATVYEPEQAADTGEVVLINSATAVRRRYYDRFAQFLAANSFTVVTYDYRGIGDSRPAHLRGFRAHARDWGMLDFAGVMQWMGDRFSGRSVRLIGHSMGGQIVGLASNVEQIDAMLFVAAQSGYWGHWPMPRRLLYGLLWFAAMPLTARVLGYFPSKTIGFGEDLPAGVAREWAHWCRNRAYPVDEDNTPLRPYYTRYTGPLLSLSFSDDGFAPKAAVDAMTALYTSAQRRREHCTPRAFGMHSVGHFGFFREAAREGCWTRAAAWLHAPSIARPFACS